MLNCLYCERGDRSVEIFGFFVHKLSDRWISCPVKNPTTPFESDVIAAREKDLNSTPQHGGVSRIQEPHPGYR
jgi:hypothetical protein